MKARIQVEGGGGRDLRARCRKGFGSFLEQANPAGRAAKVIACGSGNIAFDMFCTAFEKAKTGEFIVLLVDSESPVAAGVGPWQHLAKRDGWDRPGAVADEQVHLMVQCMEAWFLADTDCLAEYFGRNFSLKALPRRKQIEEVPKDGVLEGLRKATRRCQKGEYGKGRHSFDILEQIDPAKVLAASPHAKRLIDTLREKATRRMALFRRAKIKVLPLQLIRFRTTAVRKSCGARWTGRSDAPVVERVSRLCCSLRR